MHDFSAATIRRLEGRGVRVLGVQALPDLSSPLPWANAERGYIVDDNDCGRVLTHAEVMSLAVEGE